MVTVARIYIAGTIGYPNALYGLAISGFFFRRIKIARIVNVKNNNTANIT